MNYYNMGVYFKSMWFKISSIGKNMKMSTLLEIFWFVNFNENKIVMKYAGQHLVKFVDHTNMPNFH